METSTDKSLLEPDVPPLADWGRAGRRLAWASLGLLCALHVALLARKGLWNNEFITLKVIGLDWDAVVEDRLRLNHMPGYFLTLKAWTLVFGQGEFALRFPSALFSLGAVAATWHLVWRAWGPRAALGAAWIAAAGQNLLSLPADARMYSAVVFWSVLSMDAYLALLAGGGWRARTVHLLAGIGGLFFHLLFALVYLVQAIHWVAVRRRCRLAGLWLAGLVVVPFVVWSPWLLFWERVQYKIGQDEWALPSFDRLFREILRVVWGDYDHDLVNKASRLVSVPLLVATVAAVVCLAWKAMRSGKAGSDESTDDGRLSPGAALSTLLPWWFFTPAAPIYFAAFKSSTVLSSQRYYAVTAAAAPVAVAGAYRAIARVVELRRASGRPTVGWHRVYLGLALVVVLLCSAGWSLYPGAGLRQACRRIAREARPARDAIVLCYDGASRRAFAYYGLGDVPLSALDRGDEKAVPKGPERDRALRRLAAELSRGSDRLWLVVTDDTRLPGALAAPGSPYRQVGTEWVCGETTLFLFEKNASADLSP
ncbi:hypothetical protein JW916_00280 [Candidatus Sumerlaeota bacterium]|nr:hypothetical protein [Candidatus Sumerlaeota bacterium]